MMLNRVVELEGNSRESWQDAVGHAVSEAIRLLRLKITAIGNESFAVNRLTRLDDYSARVCVAFIVQIPGKETDTGFTFPESER